ncbi:MAG: S-formylglutathione hydrolase [Proteobacteria bacterium]|nr:S-formylglutathione hydrolase [Pseudomonadota bacterium]
MGTKIETLSRQAAHGGLIGTYRHASAATGTDMTFGLFAPAAALDGQHGPVPVLTWLAGLTCTHETFMIKAGALKRASELGLMLVAPDTSPRGEGVPDDPDGGWDFGLGAGFYLDATQAPWAEHYKMESYITVDLQQAVFDNFAGNPAAQGIFGHSMGGHGALTLGLRHPDLYKSISAFAPVCAPLQGPWGQKAFSNYLGEDQSHWAEHDASRIMARVPEAALRPTILVDQGLADEYLERELHPERLEAAAEESGYPLQLRRHEGYDHGYYFIQSFIDDHLAHHAAILRD